MADVCFRRFDQVDLNRSKTQLQNGSRLFACLFECSVCSASFCGDTDVESQPIRLESLRLSEVKVSAAASDCSSLFDHSHMHVIYWSAAQQVPEAGS